MMYIDTFVEVTLITVCTVDTNREKVGTGYNFKKIVSISRCEWTLFINKQVTNAHVEQYRVNIDNKKIDIGG